MIEVLRAPPFCTVQDQGRIGHRALGVPPSGAMDREILALANTGVGNAVEAAGLEVALGPGEFRTEREVLAMVGGDIEVSHNGHLASPWIVLHLAPGDSMTIGAPQAQRFGYLAISGGIDVPPLLGSRSTCLMARFGGLEGRLLRAGDRIPVGTNSGTPVPVTGPDRRPDATIRVIPGPQADLFSDQAWDLFLSSEYLISRSADRMGYRLEGPALPHTGPADLPSEAACPGAIQVPAGGTPIVLMPDGPTVGGYPKIAVVVDGDLGRLAQRAPGSAVRFERVSLGPAQ